MASDRHAEETAQPHRRPEGEIDHCDDRREERDEHAQDDHVDQHVHEIDWTQARVGSVPVGLLQMEGDHPSP